MVKVILLAWPAAFQTVEKVKGLHINNFPKTIFLSQFKEVSLGNYDSEMSFRLKGSV